MHEVNQNYEKRNHVDVRIEYALSDEIIERWWEIYDKSFSEINSKSPCRQSMYREEFEDAMRSENVHKVVAYEGDHPSAMMIFGPLNKNKDLFGWMSQEFYAQKYPRQYQNDSVLYFVGIFTDESVRRHGNMNSLLPVAGQLLKEQHPDAAVVFDCCDENNSWLPNAIHSLSTALPDITVQPIEKAGTQYYYGFEVSY